MVGAGLAGVAAARALAAAGHEVTVFERDAVPGGRLATVRLGPAVVDSGAQFFTVRDDRFAAAVAGWQRAGWVAEWCRGFADPPDGHPRYRAAGGMGALGGHLAEGLDVRLGMLAFAVLAEPRRWTVRTDDGRDHGADAVILTCPVPQALSLAVAAGVDVPGGLRDVGYERTIALLVALDGPTAVPAPGGVQHADAPFSFVADNAAKGVSPVPALTLHADTAWSAAHWADDVEAIRATLLAAARPWFADSGVTASIVKRWRYATPIGAWPDRCVVLADGLVLAGDAYGGPRVEGAYLSGLAAAATVTA